MNAGVQVTEHHWYLVQTKPRQEELAYEHLSRQGYECYLPRFKAQRVRRGRIHRLIEPLFPRYLFIALGQSAQSRSWSPIRSTQGVSTLVRFGQEPARVQPEVVDQIRAQEHEIPEASAFAPGERLLITQGPFKGLEGVFQMLDGEQRAMVLLELLGKPVRVPVEVSGVVAG
jgi:transcriptional antiterminator RfaH